MVGRLGSQALGALAVAGTALTVLGWVMGFLTMATISAVAHADGAGDRAGSARAAGAAYAVAVPAGILGAALITVFAPEIARLLGGPHRPPGPAVSYLRLAALGLPFLFVSFAGAGHMTGLARTRITLRIAVAANLLNIALELVLVFGAGIGLRGSALGTVAAQAAAAAGYVVASWWPPSRRPRWPQAGQIRALLRDGRQLTVRTLALSAAPAALTAVAARLGPASLAGNQIAIRVWLALALLLDALAVPAQVYVSAALGRGDPAGAVVVGRRALRLGLATGVIIGAITAVAAFAVPGLLSGSGPVQDAGRAALLIGAAAQPLAATAFVLDGLVLGLGDFAALRLAMVLALVGFAPLVAITAAWPWLGLGFLWAGYGTWLASRTALLWWRWRRFVAGPGP